MDCVDCHNRPSHILQAPDRSVDWRLPMEPLIPLFPSSSSRAWRRLRRVTPAGNRPCGKSTARCAAIIRRATLRSMLASRRRSRAPSRHLQNNYDHYFFPSMKVRWDTYATNDTHFYSAGCFRCHDGQHKSVDGSVIRSDCDTCHTILGQGKTGNVQFATGSQGLTFEHPVDIGGIWAQQACSSCHTGGSL